ncbi:MAG: DUF6285 domain-containing protein [Gammaproteobacteria bacterium]|nr:DUF6285 domain-containing protein [Gammaproteobacteria bacterium]
MHNPPDAASLLEIARSTLLEEILDALPAERRVLARMTASAMAIAAREAANAESDLARELRLLAGLYGEETVERAGASAHERAQEINRRFARDIRNGVLDGACAPGVRALLFEQVRSRLRISNPKYLEAAGLD